MAEQSAAAVANNAVDHLANGADKVFNATQDLVTHLGKFVEHVAPTVQNVTASTWEVLIRQQVVTGYMTLLWNAVMWALVVVLYFLVFRPMITDNDVDNQNAGYILMSLSFIIAVIVSCCNVPDAITHIINPKYYAGLELVEHAKALLPR